MKCMFYAISNTYTVSPPTKLPDTHNNIQIWSYLTFSSFWLLKKHIFMIKKSFSSFWLLTNHIFMI